VSSANLVVRGGSVLDGTGSAAVPADVVIAAGRIVAVMPPGGGGPGDVVDARDAVVTPGFVDVHTHSDALAWAPNEADRLRLASLLQGVTTEICGNCGSSMFPASPRHAAAAAETVRATFDVGEAFADFTAYAEGQSRRYTHLAALVGHGTLRAAVVGFADSRPTSDQLNEMCALLDLCLTQGAAGLSSGLIYPPGCYAEPAELVALARVVARHGKLYVTHLRDEMAGVEEALEEALNLANAAGVRLQVSHHKTAGRFAWGRTTQTLQRLQKAMDDGLDVACDVYPYDAASTHLHAMLPPWASDGGISALLVRLADPQLRIRMAADIAGGVPGWENTVGNGGWDRISIATAARHTELQGRRVSAIATEQGADPIDVVCDLLLDEHAAVTVISHSMQEEDVRRVLAAPFSMIGSDGVPRDGRPHPRWAGSFARVLGRYVRELGVLSLPEAVHKMTGLPAARFGLTGRGVIAPGQHADLVVLDPATVADGADFDDPLARPHGVRHVIVSGKVAVRDGEPTGVRAGEVLRL